MSLNVLVVDRAPPVSLTRGNSLIGRHVFERLAERHRLAILCPGDPATLAEDRRALAEVFDDVQLVPTARPVAAIGGWLDGELATRVPALANADRRRFAVAAAAAAGARSFDVVHVRQLPMAPHGRVFDPRPRLLELVDSESLGAARTASVATAPGSPRRDALRARARVLAAGVVESQAVRGYGAVTVVAEADAAAIRSGAPGTTVEVVPNGVDAVRFAPLEVAERPRSIVFVGAMDFPPNVAAARFLVERVLPRLRSAGVSVRLVGRSPGPAVRELALSPFVEVTGEVDDVRPYLASASLVVCPMVSGSGIKNKVLEALAMARPVVATPLAVEGIDPGDGQDLRSIVAVREDDVGFAAEIDRLLEDPAARRAMGASGRGLVLRRYTWEACADAYSAIYERLVASRSVARSPSDSPSEARSPTTR